MACTAPNPGLPPAKAVNICKITCPSLDRLQNRRLSVATDSPPVAASEAATVIIGFGMLVLWARNPASQTSSVISNYFLLEGSRAIGRHFLKRSGKPARLIPPARGGSTLSTPL